MSTGPPSPRRTLNSISRSAISALVSLRCRTAHDTAVKNPLLVEPHRVQADEPRPADIVELLLMVDVPETAVANHSLTTQPWPGPKTVELREMIGLPAYFLKGPVALSLTA